MNNFSVSAYFCNLNSTSPDLVGATGTLQEQKHFKTLDAKSCRAQSAPQLRAAGEGAALKQQ